MVEYSQKKRNRSGLSGLIRLTGPQKGKMILSGIFSVLGEGCGIVPFVLIYYIVLELTRTDEIRQEFVWTLVWAGIGAALLKYLFLGISTVLAHVSAYNILYALRVRIARKLPGLPLGYFNKNTTGRIKKIMLEDVEQMEIFIGHNLPDFIGAFVYIVLTTMILFIVDWRLGLATISVLPVGVLAQVLTMGRTKELMKDHYDAFEQMNSTMIEYIQGMPIIKAFNHTVESFNKYADSVRNCRECEERLIEKWFLPMTLYSVIVSASLLVLLPVGAFLYLRGEINVAVFVLFLLMGLGWGSPLFKLMSLGRLMSKNMEGMTRINAVLKAEDLPQASRGRSPSDHGIIASQVKFAYREEDVLKGIDLDVSAGNLIALVGPSGAGKSTVARLIARFWDVRSGSIRVGGVDIREIKLDDLMEEMSFIFQDSFLFNDSIYENLRVGNPNASLSQIKAAARAVGCDEFISGLSDGYESMIGEKSANLSGGEKQRLCIARAILKDSPVLIMDEAFAFVDPENEAYIQEAINELAMDKTLIVIAHRLSTITRADQIFLIDDGMVSARGTHEELLEKSDLYRDMWDTHVAALHWKL